MRWLPLVTLAACILGCSGSDSEVVPPAKMLNPSGLPRTAEEQKTADAYRQAGERSNQEEAAAAQQIAAAKARTGGH
jgi:hypothetical protein